MTFTPETTKTAKDFNINERDVIFCQLVAAGADRGEAYFCIYEHGNLKGCIRTMEQARTTANELLKDHPGMNVLIQRMKKKQPTAGVIARMEAQGAQDDREVEEMGEEERKKFTDKSYILAALSKVAKSLGGKERADVLMKIADLQRMKNDENKEKEEQRRYYLPWLSVCRSCKVLQMAKNLMDDTTK